MSGLDRQSLELLRDEWVDRSKPIEIDSPRTETKVYLVRDEHCWQELEVKLPPANLGVQVTSAASFVAALTEYRDILERDSTSLAKTVVFVANDAVEAVLREGDNRLERLRMALTYSAEFARLLALRQPGVRMTQADLLTLLRIELYDRVDAATIGKYRVLDWSQTTGMRAEKTLRQESLGKSVEARVQAIDDLPEYVTIATTIWEEATWITRALPLYCDPEPLQNAFRVCVPAPALDGALRSAVDELVSWLHERDENQAYTVLAGKPE